MSARGLVRDGLRRLRTRRDHSQRGTEHGWLSLPAGTESDPTVKPSGYLPIYEKALAGLRDEPFTLLEVGIWKGDSLQLWRRAFPKARIIGVDLHEPEGFVPPQGVTIVKGDQADPELFSRIRRDHAPSGFDVVIDDASHLARPTAATLSAVFQHHLVPGGLYFIEDYGTGYWDSWPDGRGPRSLDLEPVDAEPGDDWAGHSAGMVGLVKRLVDHIALDDYVKEMGEPSAVDASDPEVVVKALPIDSMEVHFGLVVLRRSLT